MTGEILLANVLHYPTKKNRQTECKYNEFLCYSQNLTGRIIISFVISFFYTIYKWTVMELQQTWRATRTLVSALFFSAFTSSSFAWFGRPEYLNITVGSSILLPCLKNKVLTLGHWERMASSRNEKWNFKDQCGPICNHKCILKVKIS